MQYKNGNEGNGIAKKTIYGYR